jgi:hypothetical protein
MSRENPFALRSFRLPPADVKAWHAAAAKSKISLSQFLRQALRIAAHEVLERHDEQCETSKQIESRLTPNATQELRN